MLNPKVKKTFTILKNKYTITILFLLVWLLFFDRYDFIAQYQTVQELKKLEEERLYYSAEIKKNEDALNHLLKDPAYLERFAREKYMMKQDNEDVFVIIDNRAKKDSK